MFTQMWKRIKDKASVHIATVDYRNPNDLVPLNLLTSEHGVVPATDLLYHHPAVFLHLPHLSASQGLLQKSLMVFRSIPVSPKEKLH